MSWNWQKPKWPDFIYNAKDLESLEREFLLRSGEFIGAFRHVGREDQDALKIELISDEALKTSEIEGEVLNRDSVQSSLRRQFGLGKDDRPVPPAERGIAEMMVDLYKNFDAKLTHHTMFGWHKMLMSGDRDIALIGGYRTHAEPMQIVSGPLDDRKIHFVAPPSSQMKAEMDGFVKWFNEGAPQSARRHRASLLCQHSSF